MTERPWAEPNIFDALNATKAIQHLPDGSPIPHGLKHTLLTLATYYPNIWPGQHRLAADMGIGRRNVNRRLGALEDAGLIVRLRRGQASTLYRLKLSAIRKCAGVSAGVTPAPHE